MYQTATDAKGDADFVDYPITANTSDGQKVEVTANVVFHVDESNVEFVYSDVGRNLNEVKTRVVANYTRSIVRNIVPSYEAIDLYTSGRVDFEHEVRDALRAQFAEYGVTLDEFSLRSITFDVDYTQVLEDKQVALERVKVKEYEAEQAEFEANRVAELARGDADAAIEKARGDAEAQVLAAKAEAEAIELRGEALEKHPEVLQLNFIKELATANWLMLPSDGIQQFLPLDVLQ
jgi:regulator of protease activity HflC (stomatin/prohibitin superfamily)